MKTTGTKWVVSCWNDKKGQFGFLRVGRVVKNGLDPFVLGPVNASLMSFRGAEFIAERMRKKGYAAFPHKIYIAVSIIGQKYADKKVKNGKTKHNRQKHTRRILSSSKQV